MLEYQILPKQRIHSSPSCHPSQLTEMANLTQNQMERMETSDEENNDENYNLGLWKKKRTEDEYCNLLWLSIFSADGIDNPSANPSVTNRIYKVVTRVGDGYLRVTPEVYGTPDPEWNRRTCITLKNPMDREFLYLEVIRTHSMSDPGTSNGEALVGRARIPLPKPLTKTTGRFGLVRLEGEGYKAEGHISLSMEMTYSARY